MLKLAGKMTRLMTCLCFAAALLPIANGDELAPAKGSLLVASESVGGEVFGKTVILLLHYDNTGAMGLVINRPTDVRRNESIGDAKLWWGGPVQMASIRALLLTDNPPEGAQEIVGSIFGIAVDEALEIAAMDPDGVRFYMGYSGWSAGQLDYEIARGSWHVLPASDEIVFASEPGLLWHRLRPIENYRAAAN